MTLSSLKCLIMIRHIALKTRISTITTLQGSRVVLAVMATTALSLVLTTITSEVLSD